MFWQEAHKTYLENIQPYLEDSQISISACDSATQLCHRHFLELLEIARNTEFESVEDEIRFFKEVQSKVYAHLVFFKQVGVFRLKYSTLDPANKKRHLKKSLTRVNKVFTKNKVFYQYILLEQDHLDTIYFTRADYKKSILNTTVIIDPKCTTPHCLLLGKLFGYRLFSKYLIGQIENKHSPSLDENSQSLKGTGKKIDLIELVYAFHAAGVFNHGNASIKTIADSLQKQFGCSIGDIYRSYTDLRYRKKTRTKFLKQLSEKLSEKMKSDEA